MRECLFHFKLMQGGKSKDLRALTMVPEEKQPDISDFIRAFHTLGYDVALENERELIFHSLAGTEPYKLDITKIELKGEHHEMPEHDGELRAILEHLVRNKW